MKNIIIALILMALPASAQTTYTYDANGRLTRVTYDGATTISYVYDAMGNLSSTSTTPMPPVAPPAGGGGGGGGGCFIATAAYGSALEPEVQALRDFRRDYMLKNSLGRGFHVFYQEYSPPLANLIREHESLRTLTRLALTPVVYSISRPRTALGVVFGLCLLTLLVRRRRALPAPAAGAPLHPHDPQ